LSYPSARIVRRRYPLLMNDINIREIQALLGRQNVETTTIHTHVIWELATAPPRPLDLALEASPQISGAR